MLGTATTTSEELLTVAASGIRSVRFSHAGAGTVTYLIDNFTFTLVPAPGVFAVVFCTFALARRKRVCGGF